MIRAGNRVHFESGLCYIEHIKTGKRTPILEKNGTFEVGIWVPRAVKQQNAYQGVEPSKQKVESSKQSIEPSRQSIESVGESDSVF